MDILEYLKAQYNHAEKKRCEEAGCKLNLGDLKEYIILKGEVLFPQKAICDCIIFLKRKKLIIGIVELKSGKAHASKVRQQLKSGVEFVLDTLKKKRINVKLSKLFIVVLSGERWHTSELKKIRENIKIYNQKFPILTKKCGIYFSEIISKF